MDDKRNFDDHIKTFLLYYIAIVEKIKKAEYNCANSTILSYSGNILYRIQNLSIFLQYHTFLVCPVKADSFQ